MGSKLVAIDDVRYVETNSLIPHDCIVYADLVRTLQLDPTKYHRPLVDDKNVLVENSLFLRAAKEAGLTEIVINGPWDGEANTHPNPEEIARNYVFFEDSYFQSVTLDDIFRQYLTECREALKHPLISLGEVQRVQHKSIPLDILEYVLNGNLVSPENKSRLVKPTIDLHQRLRAISHIRSVNGIKL